MGCTRPLQQIYAAAGNAGDAGTVLAEIFGDQLPYLVAALGVNLEDTNRIVRETAETASIMTEAFSASSDTLSFEFSRVKATLETLFMTVGKTLAPTVRRILDVILPRIEQFVNWLDNLGETGRNMVIAIGAMGVAMAGLGPVLIALGGAFATLGAAAFLMMGKMVLIAIAVGVVVGGIVLLITNWKKMNPVFKGAIIALGATTAAIWLLNIAMAANPVVLIIAAFVALAGGLGILAWQMGKAQRAHRELAQDIDNDRQSIEKSLGQEGDALGAGRRHIRGASTPPPRGRTGLAGGQRPV